ncbi:hypothetical protein KMZ29_16530 [Bradyrhizobium sediminis]|uniref:Uncharacterized protein n=1 Tax=Bradyrhizobium sediminis TaxID=2840469 RepID=A0A975NA59_9BRAD|nr:hypothetical protein [Bradyrhizobium sediminis]QWG11342.1 hypothetical protein KMZ29_16530 [Bradyrhizobium sediminis]
MSKRAAKFVSAIFASLLAGIPFATISHGAPEVADSCLAGPKGAPPQGGHWYYRIDRVTKRQCWYLGDEKEKVSRAAPETSPPPDNSASPPKDAGTRRSIANARAELPLPQTRVEQDTSVFAGQRAPAAKADAPPPWNNQRVNAVDADGQRSIVASRWPELAAGNSSPAPAPSAVNAAARPQQTAEAAPPPVIAAVTLATADAPAAKPYGSVQMLLIAMIGALSVASLIASVIFRFGGRRRAGRRNVRGDRRVNWDIPRADRPSLSEEARASASMREIDRLPEGSLPREAFAADDPNERTVRMLARLARSAAN